MTVLVAGWFSFEQMGATAGDLLARDVVCDWLEQAARDYDVAHAAPFNGGVDWRSVDPGQYSDVIFVCGPFGNGPPIDEFLRRFKGRRLTGVDLTMLEPLEAWDPFDLLLERDSSRTARPDLSLLAEPRLVPVVGLILISPQPEYGERDLHEEANGALRRLVDRRSAAVVEIDTRLDENTTGLRTPAEIVSLISRMDAVLTTRLHGLVLALKSGVPALAIDPVSGRAKIARQAETLGWPAVFSVDALDEDELERGLDYCLTVESHAHAARCRDTAIRALSDVHDRFVAALQTSGR